MKRVSLILGFILVLVVSGCENNVESANDLGSFLITYERNSGWVQYSYRVTIDESGKLIVRERARISNKERDNEYNISDEKVRQIKDKLEKMITIKLSERYGFDYTNAPTDLPTRKIKYETIQHKDSTYLYFPKENELPDVLESFLTIVEQVINDNDAGKN